MSYDEDVVFRAIDVPLDDQNRLRLNEFKEGQKVIDYINNRRLIFQEFKKILKENRLINPNTPDRDSRVDNVIDKFLDDIITDQELTTILKAEMNSQKESFSGGKRKKGRKSRKGRKGRKCRKTRKGRK